MRADTFGYLQRSFPGVASEVDAREARQAGALAVRNAVLKGGSGSIVIRRVPGKRYRASFACVPLEKVAKQTRSVPAEFIADSGNDVTAAFLDYARPLVGRLPVPGKFKGVKVVRA